MKLYLILRSNRRAARHPLFKSVGIAPLRIVAAQTGHIIEFSSRCQWPQCDSKDRSHRKLGTDYGMRSAYTNTTSQCGIWLDSISIFLSLEGEQAKLKNTDSFMFRFACMPIICFPYEPTQRMKTSKLKGGTDADNMEVPNSNNGNVITNHRRAADSSPKATITCTRRSGVKFQQAHSSSLSVSRPIRT